MNKSLATALSAVFHPLLMPSYLYYIVCYQLPGVVLQPQLPDRWQVLSIVFVFTFLLPSVGTGALYWLGFVDSLMLRERQQRAMPLLLSAISFAGATLLFQHPEAYDPLLMYMLAGMTLAVFLTFLISLRWKISAHGVGVGGALALLAFLYLSQEAGTIELKWLLACIVLAGAVLSARLALNEHTSEQAWAGLALGAGVVAGFGAILFFH